MSKKRNILRKKTDKKHKTKTSADKRNIYPAQLICLVKKTNKKHLGVLTIIILEEKYNYKFTKYFNPQTTSQPYLKSKSHPML